VCRLCGVFRKIAPRTYELFAGEADEFVNRARGAGVNVSLHCVPAGQHNFILGCGRVPEVDKAIDDMGRWLRSQLVPAQATA